MDKELLKIENLTIGFPTKSGHTHSCDHVNLEVGKEKSSESLVNPVPVSP